jgi:hypothetical protein
MRWTRSQLGRIAGGWLVLHLCLFVSAPTAICCTMAATEAAAECTCDHSDGGMCPMHHTRSHGMPAADAHSCKCRGTADPVAALAAFLTGPIAVLVPSTSVVAPAPAPAGAISFVPAPLDLPFVPDSPPPRR